MTEKVLQLSALPENEILFLLGDSNPEAGILSTVREITAEALSITRIRYLFEIFDAELLSDTAISIGGVTFSTGKTITPFLKGMTSAAVFVSTAGQEFDQYIRQLKAEGDIFREYIADAVGTVIAETAVSHFVSEIKGSCSIPYTPGYCSWDVSEQQLLFSLLPKNPCGVILSDTSLMSPIKSVSGFVAIGENIVPQKMRCNICPNTRCYNHGRR